jgi:hypothetical protein
MIDIFQKIWRGPLSVKSSLLFLLFIVLVFFLMAPLQTILLAGLVLSIKSIIDWLAKDDE